MKKTRDEDLDLLSARIEDEQEDEEHLRSVREQVYMQSKDEWLEKKRRELTQWIQRGLYAYASDPSLSLQTKQIMAESEYNIDRLEREIKAYTGTDVFQEELARAAAKISSKEADLHVIKSLKG